jgi:hypothetical protein
MSIEHETSVGEEPFRNAGPYPLNIFRMLKKGHEVVQARVLDYDGIAREVIDDVIEVLEERGELDDEMAYHINDYEKDLNRLEQIIRGYEGQPMQLYWDFEARNTLQDAA